MYEGELQLSYNNDKEIRGMRQGTEKSFNISVRKQYEKGQNDNIKMEI